MSQRTFAITIGDPQGIGPEVVLKALSRLSIDDQSRFRIYADEWVMASWCVRLSLPMPTIPCVPLGLKEVALTETRAAEIAWTSLKAASRDLNAGIVSGVATAPISKVRLQQIGFPYPGHTEFFAAESQSPDVRMMFLGSDLKLVLETIHLPLAEVLPAITREHFQQTLALTASTLTRFFDCPHPKIAVLGLNPHAGESGILGCEEETILKPVIETTKRAEGPRVEGPFASDSYFGLRAYEHYDATIAMYHDQGLIPFKLLHFDSGVNMTIGLPYLRTSPDHGCAFDIAGRGIASERSMLEAMRYLIRLS